jgi:hypothetical protein
MPWTENSTLETECQLCIGHATRLTAWDNCRSSSTTWAVHRLHTKLKEKQESLMTFADSAIEMAAYAPSLKHTFLLFTCPGVSTPNLANAFGLSRSAMYCWTKRRVFSDRTSFGRRIHACDRSLEVGYTRLKKTTEWRTAYTRVYPPKTPLHVYAYWLLDAADLAPNGQATKFCNLNGGRHILCRTSFEHSTDF